MKLTELRKKGKATYRKIALLLLIVCLFAISAPSSYLKAGQTKNVLILHSYHKGLQWTDRITQGIESALHSKDQDIELYFEYIDAKRIHDAQYFQKLYELYRDKFRNRRFDVIICSDNHAFNFLLAHRRELFPDTPIVFCGVNNFKDSMLVNHNLITGVVELSDIKSTVDVALELQPNTKRIFVIVDKTLSGTAVKQLVMKAIPYFKDALKFTFLEDLDMSEALERVKKLPHDSIVLLISLTTDKSGNTFSLEGSCALISRNSAVPVYSHADSYLGHGIVGGMLDSGESQGKKAGEMALRILHGEKVKDIPVVKKSPNRYEFDYDQMQRFGIKLSSLPKGSTVINRPYSFYSEYKRLVWSVIASIVGLVLIISILSTNIIKRRRAERALRESERRFRSIVEDTDAGYFFIDKDGLIQDVNESWVKMYGYSSKDEIIGQHFRIIQKVDDIEKAKEFVNGIMKGDAGYMTGEFSRKCKDGTIGYHTFSARPLSRFGKVMGIEGFIIDTTERNKIEKELQETKRELDIIFNSVPALIWSKNNEGKYLQVNRTYCETVGLPKEKILGRTDYDLYPTDIADQYSKYDQEIIDSKKPVLGIEEHHLKPSGDYGWSLTQKLPYYVLMCNKNPNKILLLR